MGKVFNYEYIAKFLNKLYNSKNPLITKIKANINKVLVYNPKPLKKRKTKINENQIVYHDLLRVVGNGVSEKLPLFSTRLFYEVSLLEKILGDLYVDKSLEIGCGYARLTPWIAKHSKDHYAIEPTKELYEWAHLLYPEFKFDNTSCDDLPFPSNYFDLVITWTVLQHIPPRKFKKSVEEIKRVLKDDGVLVITEFIDKSSSSTTTWGHSIEEYSSYFHSKKLVEHFERNFENFTFSVQ